MLLAKGKGQIFPIESVEHSTRIPCDQEGIVTLATEMNAKSSLKDLCRRDNNFATQRRYLADAQLPLVDPNIQIYRIKRVKDELDATPRDPLTVDRVSPKSVVTESMDALFKTKNTKGNKGIEFIVQYPSYGCFTLEGVQILSRYDILRTVKREVREEERWLDLAFERLSSNQKHFVSEALLDSWNEKSQHLVCYKGFTVTSQGFSVFCCGRYLTDEVINLLINKYCDEANGRHGMDFFALLPSVVSTKFRQSAVHNLRANVDMRTVEMIFLPMHLHGNHWGLLVFDASNCSVEYDDGFHFPVTVSIQELVGKTLASLCEITSLLRCQPSTWSRVQRFRVPMPDQPIGSGSCGVGVVYCVRDFCRGFQTKFTWTFAKSPMLRAQLMIDLLNG